MKSYTRLSLDYLSKVLNIERGEAEGLVVTLILDEKINGSIDQVQGVIVVNRLSVRSNPPSQKTR
jgi:COP9 signalosome complex subunit 2